MFDVIQDSQANFSGLISPPPYKNEPFSHSIDPFDVAFSPAKSSALSTNYDLGNLPINSETNSHLVVIAQEAANLAQDQLTGFALQSDFYDQFGVAFGDNYNQSITESIRQQFAQGDFSHLPEIKVISSDILGNANGAYADSINTIFLSDQFVLTHNLQQIAEVVTEEIGHYIDAQVNTLDSSGDEGYIFAHLVFGHRLSGAALASVKTEDDSDVITVGGVQVAIEKNDSLGTAEWMGTLNGNYYRRGWVGANVPNDFYRFYLSNTTNLSLSLTGLGADVDVFLLNSNGNGIIARSENSNTSSEYINVSGLGAGYYYLQVNRWYRDSRNSYYDLSLNATPMGNFVSFYEHDRYLGNSMILGEGNYNYVGNSWNDRISSIYIPQGWTVEAFEHDNYQGASTVFSSATSYVGNTWNDRISSVKVYRNPADYAGNNTSVARDIGTLNSSRSYSDWVGTIDTQDYYRFNVGTQSNFSLSLTGLSSDADVQLLNASGSTITSSARSGSNNESINTQLSAGTYYVRVYQFSGNTNYNLSLNATPVAPPDYAGNSTSAARDIGTLNSSRSYSDWVGSADTNDYYRFNVGTQSNFSLSLTGLSSDADVQLLNASGSTITSSARSGSNNESINTQLSAGTYYVRVYQFSGNTNYNLSLNATLVVPPDYAGNSTSAARDIGILNSSRNYGDWVGSADTNDYYRFNVETQSNFSLSLTGLSADANVQLLNSSSVEIRHSSNSYSNPESINLQLNTGTYYIRVYAWGSANTNYNLNLSGVSLSGQVEPGRGNVNLWRYNASGRSTVDYINPQQHTVVVIHGWNNNDEAPSINKLARESAESGIQVLALDWGSIANSFRTNYQVANWITPVAQWASNRLSALGIAPNQLTLIGHSFGSYVASEIGRVYGQVRNLVALDPAYPARDYGISPHNINGYDIDRNTPGIQRPVRFDSVAQYSLSFVVGDNDGGLSGDNEQAATAHDSFIVQGWSGRFLHAGETHGAVVDLFINALDRHLINFNNLSGSIPNHRDNWYDDNGDQDNIIDRRFNHGRHEGWIDAVWINGNWRIGGLERVVSSTTDWLGNEWGTVQRTWT